MELSEYRQIIRDDLSTGATDQFYTDAIIDRAINRSYKRISGLRNWPQTEQSYIRDSEANQAYYNYPTNFKTDSLKRLKYNGEKYEKTVWSEFLNYQDENVTSADDKIFSDHRRQYHLNPAPAADISGGIEIWGHEIPVAMSAEDDTTVFSGDAQVEEAIVKLAQAILYKKGRGNMYDRGVKLETEALADIGDAYKTIMKAQGDYASKNTPVFNHIDILPGRRRGSRTQRGNFNITL